MWILIGFLAFELTILQFLSLPHYCVGFYSSFAFPVYLSVIFSGWWGDPSQSASVHLSTLNIFSNLTFCSVNFLQCKNLPAMQGTQVQSMGWEHPLEKGMATHSNSLPTLSFFCSRILPLPLFAHGILVSLS